MTLDRNGQANLPAMAVALIIITTVAGVSITVVDGAFRSADREATDRAIAVATADRLVDDDSPITERSNVLAERRVTANRIADSVPESIDIRITVDGDVIYERGDPAQGTTARRLALLAERQQITLDTDFEHRTATLPRRSPRATLTIHDDSGIETVRANGRVVLHDPKGLGGSYDVSLSRYETTTLRVDTVPEEGDVTVTYYPRRTQKALVEVTVDA